MNMKGSIHQEKEQVTIYRLCGGGGEFWLWHNGIYLITPKALKYSDDPPSWVVNFILSLLYTLSNDRSVPPKNNVIPYQNSPSPLLQAINNDCSVTLYCTGQPKSSYWWKRERIWRQRNLHFPKTDQRVWTGKFPQVKLVLIDIFHSSLFASQRWCDSTSSSVGVQEYFWFEPTARISQRDNNTGKVITEKKKRENFWLNSHIL